MEFIETDKAPIPGGHYSQATAHQGLLFISGQLAIDPSTGEKKLGSIEEQTKQVLTNMEAISMEVGAARQDVLKVTIYLSDIDLWPKVNEVYRQFFGDHKPARAIVPCNPLHHGFLVELEAIAAIPEK